MELSAYTRALLDDIERRIDPDVEDDLLAQWRDFWYKGVDDIVFSPRRKKTSVSSVELKDININDAIKSPELMLDRELISICRRLEGTAEVLGIRANYGTGIIPSLFGAEIFEMPRHTNTLPTTKSFNDSNKMREVIGAGVPDLRRGFGDEVLSFGERCAEIFESYPKIKKYVEVYHPDTQGPLDLAELMWGGEMFYEMYDDPDFVHDALRVITDTYKKFMDAWYVYMPSNEELCLHWSVMQRGRILIRLDSAMNLPPEFYDEFSKPYDCELFDHFGGGCIHFCGRGDHYIDSICSIKNMYGFNMSQPHLNDMDKIFTTAAKNGKKIISLPNAKEYAEKHNAEKGFIHAK